MRRNNIENGHYSTLSSTTDSNHSVSGVKSNRMFSDGKEFVINQEEFPELLPSSGLCNHAPKKQSSPTSNSPLEWSSFLDTIPIQNPDKLEEQSGIKTSPDGKMWKIPPSMLKDQFGISALLPFIRDYSRRKEFYLYSSGLKFFKVWDSQTASTYGSRYFCFPNFGKPWQEDSLMQKPPQDLLTCIPEYQFTNSVRQKLPRPNMHHFSEDKLFYIFYSFPGEILQRLAASVLYDFNWRYHITFMCWIKTVPDRQNYYWFFDVELWRPVARPCFLDLNCLEGQPILDDIPKEWTYFIHCR